MSCNILVVGDGNLSFSRSLVTHQWKSESERGEKTGTFYATVYDSEEELFVKYGERARENVSFLREVGARVIFRVDATHLSEALPNDCARSLDQIYFNHPLMPSVLGRKPTPEDGPDYVMLCNRLMLRSFLLSASQFLVPDVGEIHLTIKDTYPYSWWRVDSLPESLPAGVVTFLRREMFQANKFPEYEPMNVEADRGFAQCASTTFVFCHRSTERKRPRDDIAPQTVMHMFCEICEKGPFSSRQDFISHEASKKHQKRCSYERQWQALVGKMQQ